jgi:hypothetical protein
MFTWLKLLICDLIIIITNTHIIAASHIYPNDLAADINQHDLKLLIQKFLYNQTHLRFLPPEVVNLPSFDDKITIYSSAVATFYSPSDISGVEGMCSEHIHAVKLWRNGPPPHDCIFVETNPDVSGMAGLDIARVCLFFSCTFNGVKYPCALVNWFSRVCESANPGTGMLVVEPDFIDHEIPST